jgi:hypothetical protein
MSNGIAVSDNAIARDVMTALQPEIDAEVARQPRGLRGELLEQRAADGTRPITPSDTCAVTDRTPSVPTAAPRSSGARR